MSDSKYGYSAKNGALGISLLRSPKAPDPDADMGYHVFRYQIMVSEAGLNEIVSEAEKLNNPLLSGKSCGSPLMKVSAGLALDSVKIAENEEGLIFRVREYLGTSVKGVLSLNDSLDYSSSLQTNMIEEPIEGGTLDFRPFEVKTFFVKRK